MSKKMLKRSLALGALMAFVITGSAMAAEPITVDGTHTTDADVYAVDDDNITITAGKDIVVTGYGEEGSKLESVYVWCSNSEVHLIAGNDIKLNGTIAAYGGSSNIIELSAGNSIEFVEQNDDGRGIYNSAKDTDVILEAENEIKVTAGIGAHAEDATIRLGASNGGESKKIIVDGYIESTGKESEITLNGNNILVNGWIKTDKYDYYDEEDNLISVDAEKSLISLNGESIEVNGVAALGTGSTVNVDGNNITINGTAWSANNKGGAIVNLGSTKKESVVTINASDMGIFTDKAGNEVNVFGKELNIISEQYGIISSNDAYNYVPVPATVNITSENTQINMSNGGKALQATSHGIINIKNGLEIIGAKYAIVTRGSSVVNIEGNGDVKLNGDIVFENYSTVTNPGDEHAGVNANVNINLTTANSYFKGNVYACDVDGIRNNDYNGYVKGMKLSLSNGAQWELSEASIVSQVTFGKDAVLILKDGSVFEKQADAFKDVYALNAGGGTENSLTVDSTAKLQIGGIKETTYNIATGFTNYDVAETLDIADNALLQANKKLEGNNYQVEVKAKDASQMAADTGISESTAGLVQSIIENANTDAAKVEGSAEKAAVDFINNVNNNNSTPEAVGAAINSATKMAEAGGNSATAANIVKNVTGVTNDRLSFNCGHSAPHKGGHGVGLFEEGSGADIWVEYVHGKDKVEDMPSTAGASSYEGQYNGIVMGVDFKKVNKFQSGIAFNYGEGDTNSVGNAVRTHSDYDFWGVGYYGNIHNDDSNVIFDINFAKTDSDVTQNNSGTTFEASPETTTWSAGVKLEKLYQNENVQIVPYTGLRYMSIDSDDYATKDGAFMYSMDRQDIWLLPLGVSIRQEIANDNGWTVSPRVDLSYIWAFGDTNSNMEVKSPFAGVSQLGYDVMDDGSFLGLVGIEAHKGQWGYGVAYSYQKGDHSESKKWYVDVNYSF